MIRKNQIKIRIGLRSYCLGPVRVRHWIELLLAAQAVAGVEAGSVSSWEAYTALADALAELAPDKSRKRLRRELNRLPLVRLHALHLAVTATLTGPRAEPPSKTGGDKPGPVAMISREELLMPAYRAARILGEPVSKMLDLDIRDFDREWKLADALLAGFELELLSVAMEPHIVRKSSRGLYDHLAGRAKAVKVAGGGKWRRHAAEARRLL